MSILWGIGSGQGNGQIAGKRDGRKNKNKTWTRSRKTARTQKREEKRMMEKKLKPICRRCGKCCIICTDVNLTNEEVASDCYKMQAHTSSIKSGAVKQGWSDKVLKQEEKFIPILGFDYDVCIYFDPEKIECLIYDDRPEVCRSFDCSDLIYSQAIFKEWDSLKAWKPE